MHFRIKFMKKTVAFVLPYGIGESITNNFESFFIPRPFSLVS